MGRPPDVLAGEGVAVAVPTGGRLPEGADAVVMSERAEATDEGVEIGQSASRADVVAAGEDVKPGATVIRGGTRLRPQHVALLAALGVAEITVHRRPRVAIVSTGDELVGPGEPPGQAQVRDANGPGLAAMVQRLAAETVLRGIVPDDPKKLLAVCRGAVAECDAVVVSAGGSVGEHDATATVLDRVGRPGVWCHGLAIKPGRPTTLAEAAKPVIGLPGNPVPALLVMQLVAAPVIERIGGLSADEPIPRQRADWPRTSRGPRERSAWCTRASMAGSSARSSPGRRGCRQWPPADGFLRVPEDGLQAGEVVEVDLYR